MRSLFDSVARLRELPTTAVNACGVINKHGVVSDARVSLSNYSNSYVLRRSCVNPFLASLDGSVWGDVFRCEK